MESVKAAAAKVEAAVGSGGLQGLVNNAGASLFDSRPTASSLHSNSPQSHPTPSFISVPKQPTPTDTAHPPGFGTFLPIEFFPIDAWEAVMNTNVTGALRCTQAFLPLLRASATHPRIVNMSSVVRVWLLDVCLACACVRVCACVCPLQMILLPALEMSADNWSKQTHLHPSTAAQAGSVSFPLFGAYSASKHALEAMSDCLRFEVRLRGV
jgi:NAD(P)-dependent dehydrogenase (short-subunit alcohol dehydrogenase family)